MASLAVKLFVFVSQPFHNSTRILEFQVQLWLCHQGASLAMCAVAKPEAKLGAAAPSYEARRIRAERGWHYKGPALGGHFSWVTRPVILGSPLGINILFNRHPLNISHILKNIGKKVQRLSSIFSNSWLPRTTDAWEPVRKALYRCTRHCTRLHMAR